MLLAHLIDILAVFRMPFPYIGNSYMLDAFYMIKFSLTMAILFMWGTSIARKRAELRKQYPPLRLNLNGDFVSGDGYGR